MNGSRFNTGGINAWLISALVFLLGIAGPGSTAAAGFACGHDCPMHPVVEMAHSCCEVSVTVHGDVMDPCDESPHGRSTSFAACCGDELCFGSGSDSQQTKARGGAAPVPPAPDSGPVLPVSLPWVQTKGGSAPDLLPRIHPPPVYLSNCVFLI